VIRSALFLRHYHLLPHGLLNRGFARLMRVRRPRWLVEAAIARWIARDRIDMSDFDARAFASLEDFFLRDLRPGARPLGDGVVCPVDGRIVATGRVAPEARLEVKGHVMSLERVVNGAEPAAPGREALPLDRYRGGSYVSIFLSPRGYHHVHMPADGELCDARWLAGRYFPQNEVALRHIGGVYERNERLTLRLRLGDDEALLVMVGASLVGGIELEGVARPAFTRAAPLVLGRRLAKGARLGHFTFGSTVILIVPPGLTPRRGIGDDVRLGEPLLSA
jgi:phosphatidylserine decarboxylase